MTKLRSLLWLAAPALLVGCQDPCEEPGALCTIAGQGQASVDNSDVAVPLLGW